MQDLGLPPGATTAAAYSINDSGQVVGQTDLGTALWSKGEIILLSELPEVQAAGWTYIQAYAINNAGQITGWGEIGVDAYPFLLSYGPSTKSAACTSSGQGGGVDRPAPCVVGNPINPLTGNKFATEIDYIGYGVHPLSFERHYNSSTGLGSNRLGAKWRHTYDRLIMMSGTEARIFRPDGKQYVFTNNGSSWVPDADVMDKLIQSGSGWTYISAPGDDVETYDIYGRLVSIANRAGVTHALTHANGQLSTVTHSVSGATLAFSYNAFGRVSALTDPDGKTYTYGYDANGNLTSVTYPDGTPSTSDNPVRTYIYNEPSNTSGANLRNHLTGIVDENGARFATYTYGTDGRALSTEHANGTFRYSLAYGTGGTTTVIDPLNKSRNLGSQTVLEVPKNTSVDQPCDGCRLASSTAYDAIGFLSGVSNFNGVASTYVHDARGLETSRIEAVGTLQKRTTTTVWDAALRLPTQVAEPLRITTNVYDADGTTCGARGALCSRSIQATTDTEGSQGFSATPSGTPRVWTYTNNANGSILTVNGPRTDVSDFTTYTYYASNTSCPTANGGHLVGCRGQIENVTNALSQVTSVTAYNAHGQPLTIVDPNGLTTTLAYDARQRLTSRSVGSEITTYEYDKVGELTKMTLPDSSFLGYSYDTAHRLTEISDNLGNRIVYTLDAMGNRTAEQVRDSANVLAQIRSREYSALNRLFKELGAQGQTTEYGYDNQGNVVSVKDPLNRVTANQYDALNRLKQVTDPGTGVTQYGYNGLDALTSVTDPRSLVTGYTVDGLGNLSQQASPDTGTTTNTYDAAGNLLTQTDAKSQTTTYTYDALNRVTQITFHDGSKQVYVYDQNTNGIGRLSSITERDPANAVTNQTGYTYDSHGRVTAIATAHGGVTYTVGYSYDGSGRLSGMTYPFGRTLTYGFDALGRVNQVSTTKAGQTQTVVSAVAYHPFGGVKGYTLGNGQTYARSIDLDGRIASYTLGPKTFALGHDAASRIEFISDLFEPVNVNTYGYDALDRLTSATTPGVPYAYGYDAVGNRTSKTVSAATEAYTYSATSNRMATVGIRNFSFDANGSTTGDGNNTYAYDTRGRMVQATSVLGATNYRINALGQRIRKTNTQADTVFHYDTSGKLIAETDPGGALKRELIYLGDIPVGAVQ